MYTVFALGQSASSPTNFERDAKKPWANWFQSMAHQTKAVPWKLAFFFYFLVSSSCRNVFTRDFFEVSFSMLCWILRHGLCLSQDFQSDFSHKFVRSPLQFLYNFWMFTDNVASFHQRNMHNGSRHEQHEQAVKISLQVLYYVFMATNSLQIMTVIMKFKLIHLHAFC